MGKKSSHSSLKISKDEKKQQLNNLIKIQRPKVYITDSSNFKNLVQQLTGNQKYSPVESSPPPPPPPPTWEDVLPFSDSDYHHHHDENNSLDLSFNSSCLTTPLEGSPDLSITGCELVGNSLDKQKMDFFKDLEAMLMEMDSSNCDYNACYETFQQDQACDYDFDLSTFI
ncbi:hypothetical protein ACS0TY_017216 [Phlomoides rotata]